MIAQKTSTTSIKIFMRKFMIFISSFYLPSSRSKLDRPIQFWTGSNGPVYIFSIYRTIWFLADMAPYIFISHTHTEGRSNNFHQSTLFRCISRSVWVSRTGLGQVRTDQVKDENFRLLKGIIRIWFFKIIWHVTLVIFHFSGLLKFVFRVISCGVGK